MSEYGSGSKWKYLAQGALKKAEAVQDHQNDIDFARSLLSNIREQRLATAQLAVGNFTEGVQSSSSYNAIANINSALAGEMKYSYETSLRQEEIQDYYEQYQEYMKKYAEQQKKRATAFAVTGAALGAALGGFAGAGLLGATAGSAVSALSGGAAVGSTSAILGGISAVGSIGQGIGQMASNTGDRSFMTGLQNVISGLSSGIGGKIGVASRPIYQASSLSSITGNIIPGSTQTYVTGLNGTLTALKGYY